jgi:hypothetical protein
MVRSPGKSTSNRARPSKKETARPTQAKKPAVTKRRIAQTKLPVRVQALKGNKFARLSWDSKAKAQVAHMINANEAANAAVTIHPPKVTRIYNDPDHVILFLWDVARNQYDGGEEVNIDDRRLPPNWRRG